MPNQQFVEQLQAEREVHASVISSIDRLLTFYDSPAGANGATPAAGGGTTKLMPATSTERKRLSDADKTRIKELILLGKSAGAIVAQLKDRPTLSQVYLMKFEMKKNGELPVRDAAIA